MKTLALAILSLLICSSTAHARLQVNGLFTDHMVLQQQMPVPIWGQAAPGKVVTVRFAEQVRKATADEKGRWLLRLTPLKASKQSRSLTIAGDGGEIALEDVVIGEVWVGSGQSNMALTLSQANDGKVALPHATDPLLRVFNKPPGTKTRESWHACSPEVLKDFSAVAYFFGKNMRKNCDVPVGLIVRSVGGTTIQRWVSMDASRQNKFINARMKEASRRKEEFARFESEKKKYDKRNRPDADTAKWLAEMSKLVHYRGLGYGGLYKRMIKPLQPLAIRGVIWYQGEFNNRAGQAFDYRDWQSTLVESWRRDWGQGEFPFLFVQMQVLGNGTTALLRESQATTIARCPKTAMAVICDQSVGLHPPNKQIAGDRLAMAARSIVHGEKFSPMGPTLKSHRVASGKLVLTFDHIGDGLVAKGDRLKGFFVAGADERFHPADVVISAKNQITLTSSAVSKPTAARYAWFNDPREVMTLFNSAELPASPFRTDTFDDTGSMDRLYRKPVRKKRVGVSKRRKPNVILVITDDQGYKDVAAHGHPYIITPNLDRLHAQSVRLTDFHVRPTCSPTRAALMSGRSPIKAGIWHTIMGRSMMNAREVTLAETFKAGGYATGMFGKWHLGDNYPMRPQDQGFDVVVQHKGGGVTQGPDYYGNDYFDDHYFRKGRPEKFKGFCTDIWFDKAMTFIEQHRKRPFFVYLSTNAPHQPWNVAPRYEKPYLDMGVAKTASPYYALITNIDENMGRLMARLDKLGLGDDTILIFMTDNGPAGGWPLRGDKHSKPLPHFTAGMKGAKGSCYEGGHRVPLFIRWPRGKLSGGRDVDAVTADIDVLPTLAEICGLTRPDGPPLDGVSFAAALHGKPVPKLERYHVIQSQRRPMPAKDARTVVIHGDWRLVLNMRGSDSIDGSGSVELFNVRDDRRQAKNLADSEPKRVREMQAAYDRWWEDQKPSFKQYSRISLGALADPTTRLMSHDWLTQTHNDCVWSQRGVTAGQMGNGPWAVQVERADRYRFELRRWPIERPGPIEADHARIQIGGVTAESDCRTTDKSVTFTVDLPAGPAMLQTFLRIPSRRNAVRGAYYVYVSPVESKQK